MPHNRIHESRYHQSYLAQPALTGIHAGRIGNETINGHLSFSNYPDSARLNLDMWGQASGKLGDVVKSSGHALSESHVQCT